MHWSPDAARLGRRVVHDEIVVCRCRRRWAPTSRPAWPRSPTRGQRVQAVQLGPGGAVGRRRHLDVDGLAGRREVLRGEAVVDAVASSQDARVRKVPRVDRGPVVGAGGRRGDGEDGDRSDDGDERGEQRPEGGEGRAAPVRVDAWGRHRSSLSEMNSPNAPIPHRHATERDEDPSVGNDRFWMENRDPVALPICFVPTGRRHTRIAAPSTRIDGSTDRRIATDRRDRRRDNHERATQLSHRRRVQADEPHAQGRPAADRWPLAP